MAPSEEGDVFLRRVRLTSDVHRLVGRYEACSANWQVYVLVKEDSVLEHPEHRALTIPPGDYILSRVSELDRERFINNSERYTRAVSD